MARPQVSDGEPAAGPDPGYVSQSAAEAPYPPAQQAPYPPAQQEPYPPAQQAAPYPPPSPYPPPAQFPPAEPQPKEYQPSPFVQHANIGVPWSTGLFDCHLDQTNATMTAFFPCVTFGQIAEILDNGQTTCTMGSLMYLVMAPALCTCSILASSYRTKLRQQYNLVQAPAEDWVLHLFCPCCSLCQEFRELKNRGIDPAQGYLGNLAQQQAAGNTMAAPQAQFMNQ
ncbi:hypothetical protein Taro_042422 [Colocasia esculenta]|uniref:Uncharacterized protein n=1 Tax=Colocasia esculenta TaxID=4460 RepID=A0A843X2K8_COLES|nr:hypothetical protein [Colocasia esculenta]